MNYSSIILPNDVNQQYILCYLKYYLEHSSFDTFTSNEVAETTLGIINNGSIITRLLTKYNLKPKKTTRHNPSGTNPTVYTYETKLVLNILQILAIDSFDAEQFNSAFYTKTPVKTTINHSFTMNYDRGVNSIQPKSTHLQSPLLVIFKEYSLVDIELYSQALSTKDKPFNFHCYYHLVKELMKLVSINDDGCITLPEEFINTDKEGYSILSRKLLKHLGLHFPIELFYTRKLHKIVTQVYNPLLVLDDLHCHHKCKNRACISPLCVTPSASHLHIPYHNKARDEHPLNDPTEHFQIIENTTLH